MKRKKPRRTRSVCSVCGKSFSYKPLFEGMGKRERCDEHPQMLYAANQPTKAATFEKVGTDFGNAIKTLGSDQPTNNQTL